MTNLGFTEAIPAHVHRRITPMPNLAWDRDTARHGPKGRVHLVYTIQEAEDLANTDIVYHYSDNAGAETGMGVSSWVPAPTSPPILVNHDDATTRSQFFPEIAVDPTTGDVAVAWHDARNDDGGSDSTANTETDLYVTAKLDADTAFLPNVRVSEGLSWAVSSDNSHGDYIGLAFHDGVIHPVWVDNSNSTLDNPDHPLPGPTCGGVPCMDPYTSAVVLPEPDAASQVAAGAFALLALARRRQRTDREV